MTSFPVIRAKYVKWIGFWTLQFAHFSSLSFHPRLQRKKRPDKQHFPQSSRQKIPVYASNSQVCQIVPCKAAPKTHIPSNHRPDPRSVLKCKRPVHLPPVWSQASSNEAEHRGVDVIKQAKQLYMFHRDTSQNEIQQNIR